MERILTEWRKWKKGESIAGLSKKERARKKHSEESSNSIRRSMGAPKELFSGEEDLNRLSKGIYEEEELTELNPYHDPKTGKLSSGKTEDVYSLSQKATDAAGVDRKYSMKGTVGKSKDKDGKPKLRHKFGMAQKCGRRPVSGPDIDPKLSCSKFSDAYLQEDGAVELEEDEARVSREYVKGMMKMELGAAMEELRGLLQQASRKSGGCSLEQVIRVINQFELAQKAKAFEQPEK